jgi:hypothetical protein
VLQAHQPCLARGIEQQVVVAPIAQAEGMNPRQKGEHDAHFETQDDEKDDA